MKIQLEITCHSSCPYVEVSKIQIKTGNFPIMDYKENALPECIIYISLKRIETPSKTNRNWRTFLSVSNHLVCWKKSRSHAKPNANKVEFNREKQKSQEACTCTYNSWRLPSKFITSCKYSISDTKVSFY